MTPSQYEARPSGVSVLKRLFSRPNRCLLHGSERSAFFDGLFGAAAFIIVLFFIAEMVDTPMAKVTRGIDLNVARFLDAFSQIGSSFWIMITAGAVTLVASVLSLWAKRLYQRAGLEVLAWRAGFLFVDVALSVALVQGLKFVMGRTQPAHSSITNAFNFCFFSSDALTASFPSGHTTTIFAVAAAMAIFVPRYQSFFLLIALAVATARLAIGFHYASDILGGMVLGVVLTIGLARYCARRRIVFQMVDGRLVRRGELLVRRALKPRALKNRNTKGRGI